MAEPADIDTHAKWETEGGAGPVMRASHARRKGSEVTDYLRYTFATPFTMRMLPPSNSAVQAPFT